MGDMTAPTPAECLVRYGRAWFERDPAARVEALHHFPVPLPKAEST
jgi:hypothetical protein